ncbi:hypothetical protein CH063_07002 [Colletotrichum higginsianum]|uniref:Uncharacterized protein n=2 Tax=Colletotrichum higginsianum TaxID=80884 RepID=H1V4K8_COLHI|nr:hypothetical protein CH63R_13460 [Colletotrichum higginsianum IMI 349063]OBR02234.1 hypothetical protein CH63R_13460 [Colletotrichum higginsianum IMI 349063]GJD00214.1 hypothetical protein ColKHC_09039 [Colletotrichum higginsianum]CCF35160.1 hypothetical protein CH063_07002 [Colletotrichum higginsianum]
MMLKSLFVYSAVLALSAVQVAAHAAINPVMGVTGTAARKDVKRPSNNAPCGNGVNIASAIGSSTSVQADSSGSFTVNVQNFNGGKDGSRQVTMKVDAAGDGKTFVDGTVSANGQLAPASTGTEKVTASLPAGTKCSGGASGDLCIASFTTAGGFGNCVVVQQAGGGSGAAAGANAATKNNAKGVTNANCARAFQA